MPRLLGLAQASKVYRNHKDLQDWSSFSHKGNEIAFGTIGNASSNEKPKGDPYSLIQFFVGLTYEKTAIYLPYIISIT